jgi:colanic acid/amylovoran biosynthesis glycosyltransferase
MRGRTESERAGRSNITAGRHVPRTLTLSESRRPVLIFRSDLLSVSETFILAQANALRRFEPRFVGLRRVHPSLRIPDDAIVAADGDNLLQKCARGLYKRAGIGPRFHKKVQESGAHLIHAHFAVDGVLALPLAKRLKVPLIVTLHGYDVTISDTECSKSQTGRLYLRRRRMLWQQVALFLCVSDFIQAKALEAGFPECKLRRHHIGVDPREFRRTDEPQDLASVLFVGRLVEKKGCDVLIQAMDIVQRELPDAVLTIIGDGPMRESLDKLAASLGVKCRFLGRASSEQIKQTLQRSTIVCVPSRTAANGDSEGLPIVLLEAQAMGVPVVSSFHAGISEAVIHGETGLLAPEGDYHALAQHLLLLLRREDLRVLYGSRGIQWVRRAFDIERQTRRLEDIYEEILAETTEALDSRSSFSGGKGHQ